MRIKEPLNHLNFYDLPRKFNGIMPKYLWKKYNSIRPLQSFIYYDNKHIEGDWWVSAFPSAIIPANRQNYKKMK